MNHLKEFQLPIGIKVGNSVLTYVTLSKIDGVAEKIILSKAQSRPYTWQANVLTASIEDIDGVAISADAKREYLRSGKVEIPDIVKKMSLADVTTCMTEIHRRSWQATFEDYPYGCGNCGHKGKKTIDLFKCDYDERFKEEIESGESQKKYHELEYILKAPFEFVGMKNPRGESNDPEAEGKPVIKLVFTLPNLLNAINSEKLIGPTPAQQVEFWRNISMDCLKTAYVALDEGGEEIKEIANFKATYKTVLFDKMLVREDLAGIRSLLRENMPVLPFMYADACDNCGSDLPMIIEPSDFFGE